MVRQLAHGTYEPVQQAVNLLAFLRLVCRDSILPIRYDDEKNGLLSGALFRRYILRTITVLYVQSRPC